MSRKKKVMLPTGRIIERVPVMKYGRVYVRFKSREMSVLVVNNALFDFLIVSHPNTNPEFWITKKGTSFKEQIDDARMRGRIDGYDKGKIDERHDIADRYCMSLHEYRRRLIWIIEHLNHVANERPLIEAKLIGDKVYATFANEDDNPDDVELGRL